MTPTPKNSSANWPVAPRTLIAGAIIGGAAAILIPLTARRFRRRGAVRTACALKQAKKSLYEAAAGVAETATDFAAASRKHMQDAAMAAAEAGRQRARQEAERLTNAVNAGVEAYSRGV